MLRRIDWGDGRELVGDGPGLLLMSAQETLDLRTGQAANELKKPLQGYEVLSGGELDRLVHHLSRIHGGFNFGGISDSQNYVLCEIARIIGEVPDNELDEALRRLTTKIKAARRVRQWSGLERINLRLDSGGCRFWADRESDKVPVWVVDADYGFKGGPGSLLDFRWAEYLELGQLIGGRQPSKGELLAHIEPAEFCIRTKEDSIFAQVATELSRVPTKKDIREALCVDYQTLGRLCAESGFVWLPESVGGRPKS
jgi:hypothetical protein